MLGCEYLGYLRYSRFIELSKISHENEILNQRGSMKIRFCVKGGSIDTPSPTSHWRAIACLVSKRDSHAEGNVQPRHA